jgi:hypothetical protein
MNPAMLTTLETAGLRGGRVDLGKVPSPWPLAG